MRVYVASAYSLGSEAHNVRVALEAGEALLHRGYSPYVPHLNHLWHLVFPHSYETWMALDAEYLTTCAAVWRLPGESSGADREVAQAQRLRIPVFYKLEDFPPLCRI
jgi:hypothetical protein